MQSPRDKNQKFKLLFTGTFIVLLAFSVLISEGCDQGYTLSNAETSVVVTNYDKGFDFTAQSTFSLPDEVKVIDPNDENASLDPALNNLILQVTQDEMTFRGYTLETNPDTNTPDLEIKIFATTTNIYGASGGYCWWYYSGCYWYNPPYVYYKYSTGTLFTHMSNPDAPDVPGPGGESGRPPVWSAGLNGVISSSASDNATRVKQMIQQSFDQSPYLTAN